MRRIIIYFFLVLFSITSIKASDDLVIQGDSAYNSLAYTQALELYQQAIDSIGSSSDLYYNIANTYYRLNNYGKAILWYERALQLDPTNKDAIYNLAFVNTRITDKPVDNRNLIAKGYDRLLLSAHPNTWAWTAFILFALSVIAVVGYLTVSAVFIRKICFFTGGIILFFSIVTLILSFNGSSKATNHDMAIIISPSAKLSTAPRASNDAETQAFLLHEGTKVEIVDSVINTVDNAGSWYEVRVAGNARAWVNSHDIERI